MGNERDNIQQGADEIAKQLTSGSAAERQEAGKRLQADSHVMDPENFKKLVQEVQKQVNEAHSKNSDLPHMDVVIGKDGKVENATVDVDRSFTPGWLPNFISRKTDFELKEPIINNYATRRDAIIAAATGDATVPIEQR